MSLWKIAWRSIQQRGVASALTTLSMALGVMLVVVVLSIHGVISQSFRNNSTLGYNMIVGAKGGKLQLTLNTVYYLSQPVENIPYDYYLEFMPAHRRQDELKNSIAHHVHQAQWKAADLQAISAGVAGGHGLFAFASSLAVGAAAEADSKKLDHQRPGRFGLFVELAIPLCLGDYFGNFRVVGTTPAFFDDLVYDLDRELKYQFAQGRNFRHDDEQHGYFEAVIGSTVAREMKVKVGDQISPAHGEPGGHEHEQRFTVVGILKATGTPNDRAVFVNMEGFYLMADHAKPVPRDEEAASTDDSDESRSARPTDRLSPTHAGPDDHADHHQRLEPLPVEQREVTSLLVRTVNPLVTPGLQNTINEAQVAQAVLPIQEIFNLFEIIVKPIQGTLVLLTAMICIVSGVSILVSIYNSMSDRRHEIAVMRALGAGRTTVMTVILLESIILSLGGGLFGWSAAHILNALASPWVEARTGVTIGLFDFAPKVNVLALLSYDWEWMVYPEFILIPALVLLAVVVGFLPAMAAYRTDVAKSLGK